jgi:TRAP-type C4-dicarboxylate transport system permease small subunit
MRSVSRVSNVVLGLEKRLITALAGALVVLILLNVVTRAAGAALFWVDELAVYTMIWMALIGASAMVRMRTGVAVTLVTDLLPGTFRRIVHRTVDAVLLGLALVLLVLCWQWYDPVALFESGFDLDVFAQNTFKFIYAEPTSTIGIPKFWVWLAVPLIALAMTIHALANLLEGPRDEASGAGTDVGARPSSGA